MNGKVKWFNQKHGYGFISGEDQEVYFFHISQIKGFRHSNYPTPGQAVTFASVSETKKGKEAIGVTVIGDEKEGA